MDSLPTSLQHLLLLEWLSPEAVCRVARAGSSALRSAVLSSPNKVFRAANGVVVGDGCIRWFRETTMTLVLWTTVELDAAGGEAHKCNGRLHRDDDLPAVIMANNGPLLWYQRGRLFRAGGKSALVWPGLECATEFAELAPL